MHIHKYVQKQASVHKIIYTKYKVTAARSRPAAVLIVYVCKTMLFFLTKTYYEMVQQRAKYVAWILMSMSICAKHGQHVQKVLSTHLKYVEHFLT